MCRIIACANQKGGVGKTTTALNLAAALAEKGFPTLIVDLDPQGNATVTFGLDPEDLQATVADVLLGKDFDPRYAIYKRDRLHLIPATLELEQVAVNLHAVRLREHRLDRALMLLREQYDFIFIDCPPSIGVLTENALVAADEVIIPVDMGFYAMVGITQVLGTMEDIRETLNPNLKICGFLPTKVEHQSAFAQEIIGKLHEHFNGHVFNTVIRLCHRLQEAPSHGMTIFEYDRESPAAEDYNTLALEVMRWTSNPDQPLDN
jgi:chromosome partitioning protein